MISPTPDPLGARLKEGSVKFFQGLKARHIKILFEKGFYECVGPSALLIEENAALGLAAQAGMCRAVGAGGHRSGVLINLFDTQIFYLLCYLTLQEIIFHFLAHPDSECDLKRVELHSSAQIQYWLHSPNWGSAIPRLHPLSIVPPC